MNKYEYRCDRCLIIQEQWLHNSKIPFNNVPCYECGGLSIRIPLVKSKEDVFEVQSKRTG